MSPARTTTIARDATESRIIGTPSADYYSITCPAIQLAATCMNTIHPFGQNPHSSSRPPPRSLPQHYHHTLSSPSHLAQKIDMGISRHTHTHKKAAPSLIGANCEKYVTEEGYLMTAPPPHSRSQRNYASTLLMNNATFLVISEKKYRPLV